jgi:hypothetical protein
LAAGLWLTVAVPAGAAGTPDARYITPTTSWLQINGTQMLAQTFTALNTGQLDQVDLPLGGMWNSSGKIYIVPSGATVTSQPTAMTSSSFGSYSGQTSCCSVYGSYTIAPAYPVTANGHYAIVVVPNPGTSVMWGVVFGGAYPGGQVWKGYQPSTWFSMANMAFDFKTYVTAGSAASAPTVTRVKSDVPVFEGTAPTNSGTFADAAGLTVHLTASSGTLGYTPSTSGNWTWAGTAADEGPSQTILISADDGKGGTAQATFTTESNRKAPTATIHGASASVKEGATITLTASAISDSADDNNAGFRFNWTATEYGNALPSSTAATYAIKVDDEGSYTITLQATDDGGVPSAIVSVTIAAVDSKPNVSGLQVWNPVIVTTTQQTLTFTGNSTDDGSTVDTYKASWNFGDGNSSALTVTPAGLTASHPYAAPGIYTATLTVQDDDGVTGSASTTVTVLSPLQALGKIGNYLQGLTDLQQGPKNSLQVKLNAAADSFQRGDTGAACNQLNAFINEVDADQKSGRLTTGEAGNLTDAARLTQRSMGCFKPLVEFLSGL